MSGTGYNPVYARLMAHRATMTRRCSVKSSQWAVTPPSQRMYVGRSCYGYLDLGWGNPFKIDESHGAQIAVAKYRDYILTKANLITGLDKLRGKVLGCWCNPEEPCHADALIDLCNLSIPDLVTLIEEAFKHKVQR